MGKRKKQGAEEDKEDEAPFHFWKALERGNIAEISEKPQQKSGKKDLLPDSPPRG